MSAHREPRPTDPPDALLDDDCPRCAEHAKAITTLDDAKLRAMLVRTYEVERQDLGSYRTRTEAEAGRRIWHVAMAISVVTGIDLDQLLAVRPFLR